MGNDNYDKLLKLQPLAERGDANAQYELARMYLSDLPGVQQNRPVGMQLLLLAGAQGHSKARDELWGYVKHMDEMRAMSNLPPMRPPNPQEWWVPLGLCRYCGGEIGGLFKKKCIVCGKPN